MILRFCQSSPSFTMTPESGFLFEAFKENCTADFSHTWTVFYNKMLLCKILFVSLCLNVHGVICLWLFLDQYLLKKRMNIKSLQPFNLYFYADRPMRCKTVVSKIFWIRWIIYSRSFYPKLWCKWMPKAICFISTSISCWSSPWYATVTAESLIWHHCANC